MDARRLIEYLRRKAFGLSELRMADLNWLPGDASRETYSFDAEWVENGTRRTHHWLETCERNPMEEWHPILHAAFVWLETHHLDRMRMLPGGGLTPYQHSTFQGWTCNRPRNRT